MSKKVAWIIWILLSLGLAAFFGNKLFGEGSKSTFLIGESTYGHYQIEMACETCHSDPFGGEEILQNACTQCHADELDEAHDSHPKSKFTDPRNADRIEILDARYCINCHTEHKLDKTHAMGVTLPDDYCWHCHQDIADERESHKDLEFDSCASAGCHNYHDNRALYEDFLVENAHQEWLTSPKDRITSKPRAVKTLEKGAKLTTSNSRFQEEISLHRNIAEQWQHSSHAEAGVDCGGCHISKDNLQWLEKPNHEQCATCHNNEVNGFLAGKHGMRLSGELSSSLEPITPEQAHLPFKAKAKNLTHGCNSCHGAHDFNIEHAAVEGCLGCHNDSHSTNYTLSPHGQAWSTSSSKQASVTCATCHMPKKLKKIAGEDVYAVEHNQNWNLRPNEKMIRSVCMDCHGLEFSINALADEQLIQTNFNGKPKVQNKSIDWALKRAQSQQ